MTTTVMKAPAPVALSATVIDDDDLAEHDGITEFSACLVAHLFERPQVSSISGENLVASVHRRALAPRGFRFVANLDLSDYERAVRAIRQTPMARTLRLVTPAVDAAGRPVPDVALYVRADLPEPESFWIIFHSLGHDDAA